MGRLSLIAGTCSSATSPTRSGEEPAPDPASSSSPTDRRRVAAVAGVTFRARLPSVFVNRLTSRPSDPTEAEAARGQFAPQVGARLLALPSPFPQNLLNIHLVAHSLASI